MESTDERQKSTLSFFTYLNRTTWWWMPILFFSIIAFCTVRTSASIVFLILCSAPWIFIKWRFWKTAGADDDYVNTAGERKTFSLKLFAIALLISAFPAYVVGWGPDRAAYERAHYEVAAELGYTGRDAVDLIDAAKSIEKMPDYVLFITNTGLIWFLVMISLYTWRAYVLLRRFSKASKISD